MKVVLCHGTFDLLHIGHVALFAFAKSLGDHLIVSVTADAFVHKGPGRPVFNEDERAMMIKSVRYVDEVHICRERSGIAMIALHRPAIYVKGEDYATSDKHGLLGVERRAVESYGGKVVIADGLPMSSSTSLIERVSKWKEAQHAFS